MATTDTTAAPETRYAIGNHGAGGCYVIDRVSDKRVSPNGLTWAAAHCEAQRLNREARAANKPAAAPDDRYVAVRVTPPRGSAFYDVVDRVMGVRLRFGLDTLAAAYSEAQRFNRETRAANEPAADQPAPCCDCATKLKAAEEKAERYRHALAQIWRYCSGTALRYAAGALFPDARKGGEDNGR